MISNRFGKSENVLAEKIEVVSHDSTKSEPSLQDKINELNKEIHNLNNRIVVFEARDAGNVDKIAAMYKDFNILNSALLNEATVRGWCSDYTDFVEKLNSKKYHFELDYPVRKYNVRVEITRELSYSGTIQVEASSDEEAHDIVYEMDIDDIADSLNVSDLSDWDVDNEAVNIKTVEAD